MYNFYENEWGLVLCGGGGKGSYQVGVFRALFENKINDYITCVSGVSCGLLNSILFANGSVETAVSAWMEITPKDFIGIEPDMIDLREGLVSRDGLIRILNKYIDLCNIRLNEKTIYGAVTDYGPNDEGNGISRYYRLNYRPENEIKDILLASSALPIIYSPVKVNGNICRDGGLTDNMPISPLYAEGIRKFIVVGLSDDVEIDKNRYPEAEFLLIRPEQSIGDFLSGTLDFSASGARKRMEIGYIDAIRCLEFYKKDMTKPENVFAYQESVRRDYMKIMVDDRRNELENSIERNFNNINDIINKYIGE